MISRILPQGISFSYNKNDIGKIFKIDSSNNNIHYKPSNNNHLGNNNIIQAQIPDNSYDLVGINFVNTKHGGTSIIKYKNYIYWWCKGSNWR